jgi:hypothetical protein
VGSTVMARENVARSEMVGGDSLEPRQLSGVVGLGAWRAPAGVVGLGGGMKAFSRWARCPGSNGLV